MQKNKIIALILAVVIFIAGVSTYIILNQEQEPVQEEEVAILDESLVLIEGGTFQMGSPTSEAQREKDETQHEVTVNDFYISAYEVTQSEYESVMKENPSNFSGDQLPVENVTWLQAIEYCNALSTQENLTPVYTIDGDKVSYDQGANGYRLPTEAEWEYACRATTTTPFNTETSISDEEANYYGHYPYLIEENYFSQDNLETKPGQYRQTTTNVGTFKANKWGLYDMHGNVREWVFDSYGEYDTSKTDNPVNTSGELKVTRGGSWNDYAKHLRSAYRSSKVQSQSAHNIGFRIARNATERESNVVDASYATQTLSNIPASKTLIVYFSWGGNTEGIAEQIQDKTGSDIFEIELVKPYSSSYNTVLDEAQRDVNANARPEIKNKIENFDQYDAFMIGYPNWWATIPMPIATLLESYDFSGKRIIPFCSHGGGEFGESVNDITKLAPQAIIGEPLSIHYSGDSSLSSDIDEWINTNKITK